MSSSIQKQRRSQLDRLLRQIANTVQLKRPKAGWVREIRTALGMSAVDLASRLGVISQRVSRLERDEVEGRLTLETMRKTADAMNCDFVYFLVPRRSLSSEVLFQARQAAKSVVSEVEHSMELEGQKPGKRTRKELIEELAQEMVVSGDRRIWKVK